ncbi:MULTISPECIES: PEP-CTERM sorting domain-containing protein [unclassified Massilia]|uniref:PEP-CTERM sorting domain-containing protein n=1 Tax=unclassified Massilia TaxID=2609279 RepID=UPI000AD85E25|nr:MULTISPECIES: PEP-CTERM sorting domain-containing protein [unclassified Massilia]
MTTRYLIAAALMASACAAHADVVPTSQGGVINGSDVLVQALYEKVSASIGSDMKVSLKKGADGVYVTGLSTAKAAALAGDGMSVIGTPDGFKIVDNSSVNSTVGGGANVSLPMGSVPGPSTNAGSPAGSNSGSPGGSNSGVGLGSGPGNMGNGNSNGNGNGNGNVGDIGNGNGTGNAGDMGSGSGSDSGQGQAAAVPEPSTIALMLAGMLGVAGLGRRRAR